MATQEDLGQLFFDMYSKMFRTALDAEKKLTEAVLELRRVKQECEEMYMSFLENEGETPE